MSAYDSVATDEAQKALGDIELNYAASMNAAIKDAHVVMVVTSWPEFAMLPKLIAPLAHQPLVIDGRRMLSPDSVTHYEGIGRGDQTPDSNVEERDDDQMSSAA